jgi:hypothetical protein
MFLILIGLTGLPQLGFTQTVKAFPTAEGFGAETVGGRGGVVLKVTTLDDSGPGSLREALLNPQPRTIVFTVSGTITLQSVIQVKAPYVTIAGQTSPGGIQIKGNQSASPEDWGVWFVSGSHDIIIRHVRFRFGGGNKDDRGANLLFYNNNHASVYNAIVDHCEFQWGSDSMMQWYGEGNHHFTMQWNMSAQGARDAAGGGGKGDHIGGFGSPPTNVSYHHNLLAHNQQRNPLVQHVGLIDFRNNVIYNWGGNNGSVFGQFALNHSVFANIINNVWKAGANSGTPYLALGNGGPKRVDGSAAEAGGTKVYVDGNVGPGCLDGCADQWSGLGINTWDAFEWKGDGSTRAASQAQYGAGAPYPVAAVTTHATAEVLATVLQGVGTTKPARDAVSAGILAEVANGAGTNALRAGGAWPTLAGDVAPPDTDGDGMPDAWETAHGLNPHDATDGPAVAANGNGYTNLENYLNALAGDPVDLAARTQTQLRFPTPPPTALAGQPLAPVVVQVQDSQGQLVTTSTAPITVALQANPGGSALGGTLTQPATGGQAIFWDLTLTQPAAGYVLKATAALQTPTTSLPFAVTTGATDLTTGLVAYYKLDAESGTTAVDTTPQQNTGTLRQGPTWVRGYVGRGVSFARGGTQLITVPAAPSVDNLGAMTWAGWVLTRSVTDLARLADKADKPFSGWRLFQRATGALGFHVDYGTTALETYSAANALTLNTFQHVAVTWDGSPRASGVHLYVNGVAVEASPIHDGDGPRLSDSARALVLANRASGDRPYDGIFDEVRVYSRALRAADVAALAAVPPTP